MTRIEREKRVVEKMVRLYCRHKEENTELCDDCAALIEYVRLRLNNCKFGNDKPTCRKCPIHCYKPEMREKIRRVMRYSGPRMLFYSPIMAIGHIWREIFR